jgi:TPR repeat protein
MMLAEKYYYGDDLPQDLQRAVELFRHAASDEVPEAFTFLADCHWDGLGVERDLGEALRLYEHAAELGDPQALYTLGLLYDAEDEGEGGQGAEPRVVERDPERARRCLEQAAAEGHGQAATLLAQRCVEGDGVPVDPARGVEFLRVAVEEEDPDALFMMAECLRDGVGVEVDLARAFELFQLAAIQGRDARVELGQLRRRMRET